MNLSRERLIHVAEQTGFRPERYTNAPVPSDTALIALPSAAWCSSLTAESAACSHSLDPGAWNFTKTHAASQFSSSRKEFSQLTVKSTYTYLSAVNWFHSRMFVTAMLFAATENRFGENVEEIRVYE